jgi:hypothetical protein
LTIFTLFGLLFQVDASRIQMGVTLSPPERVSGGDFEMNLTVVNSGDEAAHDVQASLLLPDGFSSHTLFPGTMEPGIPYNGRFNVSANETVNPGLYPIVLKTHYTDANAYPFSTVSPAYLRYKTQTPIMLRGQISDLTLAGQGEKDLEVAFSNLDEKPHNVLVRLHIPDELKTGEYSEKLGIMAKDEGKVRIPLKSFGALPGSVYIIFASAEYDEGGLHYSSIASGKVEIVGKEEGGFQMPTWIIGAVLAVLILAAVYYQVKK